ncbi:IS200/IS605 family transposase [Cryomorpha ignava]|uniref:IS200/IS605 family transposase n=1 Tax=Cryomorpha ignava TaxID=101383 RepID=A0A7K3WSD9_9FLAO|nr:IS200/IS605 family transposase [Cryomorpha ignava]NEN24607.1 IS200/IS605 family transposase [Cryomorpha ignava]
MGQSLVIQYTHIVFSTKNREKLILPSIEAELFDYLGGVCNEMDCQSLIVGGHLDHVHILCKLSKNVALAKLLEQIKSNSSKWIKTIDSQFSNFFWQDGYGAFSVSRGHVDIVTKYIGNQHAHHCDVTFKNEFLGILKKNDVEYDERHIWD